MSDLRVYSFIVLVGVGFEAHALPDPLPECYAVWLFYGRNFERGDDPDQSLREAQQAFEDYSRELAELDIEDMDLGILQNRIGSARDLLGPETLGRSPPHLRTYVENATRQHSKDVWPEDVLGRPCGLVDAVVHFRDGTAVRLEAEAMTIGFLNGKFRGFDYHVDENSMTGLNGQSE